jgi:ribosomal protein L11 methyltransferase
MTAQKLVVSVADRTIAHHIAGILSDLFAPAPDAVTVFEEPGSDGTVSWLVEAYFEGEAADPAVAAVTLGEILEMPPPLCRLLAVPDENWVARSQAALPPVYAGRFTIHGSHDRGRVGRGWNAIEIDAGEAFGTAHHATTYGCLLTLDQILRRRRFRRMLDLGTGSGVLALAAQRAQPSLGIIATDLDERSIEVAQDNAAANALTGRLDRRLMFVVADGVRSPAVRERSPFDLVVSNILAGPLIKLAPDIARHLRPGGVLVLSGLLVWQAPEVIARYRALGFALSHHRRYVDWSTLAFDKMCCKGREPGRVYARAPVVTRHNGP